MLKGVLSPPDKHLLGLDYHLWILKDGKLFPAIFGGDFGIVCINCLMYDKLRYDIKEVHKILPILILNEY